MNVDVIISYVNPNDIIWQKEYLKYKNESNEEYKENRFRDTSFLKYVLRSIAKYMQWVNNVYLVVQSESQVPSWVNRDTVKIVLHEDFIPKEYLPVFSSCAIEMFLHKINNLSDYFIYFNDDMILNQPCYKTDFFINNKCNVFPLKYKITKEVKGTFFNNLLHNKTAVDKILNIQNNEEYFYKFSHTITPLYRPLCEECYNKLEDEIKKRTTKFRELNNFNQHLFAYYIYATGNSNKISVPVIYVNMDKYNPLLTTLNIKTICINDLVTKDIECINTNRNLYLSDLENKFNTLSKYEIQNMKKYKYDFGLFGYTMGDSYGGAATYYALYYYIKSLGKNVCIIPPVFDKNYCRLNVDFFKTHCECLPRQKFSEMTKYNDYVDAFIIGSDQMWNAKLFKNWKNSVYLDFVNENHKKIAYGVSFGKDYCPIIDIDPTAVKDIKMLIHKFSNISCREKTATNIVKNLLKYNNAETVLDPVFLVNPKIWDMLINEIYNKHIDASNDLTFYMISSKLAYLNTFHKIAKKMHLNESLILTNNVKKLHSYMETSITLDNEYPINPPRHSMDFRYWLKYMRDSNKILTSSFHGICFSIIFKKNFLCFEPNIKSDTRKQEFLKELGLEDRLIGENDVELAIKKYNEEIDWQAVYEKLEKLINYSKEWLNNALL